MIRIINSNNTYVFQKGVTLVELLIVIAIIAILSAISYPSYTSYVLKSHRAEALEVLTKIQLHIESEYPERTESTAKEKYQALLELTIDKNTGACLDDSVCKINNKRYSISYSLTNSGMNIYKLSAIPQSDLGQDSDSCGTLTLNAGGVGTGALPTCW
ncbi:type IV pilin protein [Aliivibrio fischeri]|uniref:type IV pilin protein n=1 Tax=Aliivibrio fischeri TaxID=668 RepID=UPI00080EB704|nr:type IV pilin protein [Aliivibrio fischeri]OCH07231.1 pilin [Aliivibrio fischeri]OCH33762.1 pilin [Aliivibrio fischeri]